MVFGEVANKNVAQLKDLGAREAWVLGGYAAAVLLLGVWPKPLTDLMEAPIAALVQQLLLGKA